MTLPAPDEEASTRPAHTDTPDLHLAEITNAANQVKKLEALWERTGQLSDDLHRLFSGGRWAGWDRPEEWGLWFEDATGERRNLLTDPIEAMQLSESLNDLIDKAAGSFAALISRAYYDLGEWVTETTSTPSRPEAVPALTDSGTA